MTELQLEIVEIDSIEAADYNPRRMTAARMQKLKRSIQEFGWAAPITVNERLESTGFDPADDRRRIIIGGHQRVRAAKELGMTEVPIIVVHFDPTKEKAANIALNNAEITGEWDEKALAKVLSTLDQDDPAMLAATGFNENQIAQFMKALEEIPEAPTYPLTPRLLEKYDYVVITVDNEIDWANLESIFGLEKRQSYKKGSKAGLGLCHVVTFEDFKRVVGK